jgi:hypothetical protein
LLVVGTQGKLLQFIAVQTDVTTESMPLLPGEMVRAPLEPIPTLMRLKTHTSTSVFEDCLQTVCT